MWFSKENGFTTEARGGSIKISKEKYLDLLAKQSSGLAIVVNDQGMVENELPPEETLAAVKEAALLGINFRYENETAKLSSGYPENEQKSWPVQVMESAAVIAGAAVDTPWIDAAAEVRGVDRIDLAERIRDMDIRYRQIHGALTGRRQFLIERLIRAASKEEVALVVWDAK